MNLKKLISMVLFVSIILLAPLSQSHGRSTNPQQFVRDFYAWYLKVPQQFSIHRRSDEIYKYVTKETVEYAKINADELDYFTQMGYYHAAWENVQVIVGNHISMELKTFAVPVTFEFGWGKWHVVVFVKEENNALYIVNVTDIFPYS